MHSLPYMLQLAVPAGSACNTATNLQCHKRLDQLHSVHAECDATPQRLKPNGSCILQSMTAVLITDGLVIRQSLEIVACLYQPIVGVKSIVGASIQAQWLLA